MSLSQFRLYIIKNTINGKVYIGKTAKSIEQRFAAHLKLARKRINRRIYDAMNRYGYDNFSISEIDIAESNEEASEKESWYIFILHAKDPAHGYNMTHGGDGGDTGTRHYGVSPYEWWVKKHGKEKADKIVRHQLERVRQVNRELRLGSIMDETTKMRISETLIRKGIKPPLTRLCGVDHPMFGKSHSDESKDRMSAARRGKTYEDIMSSKQASMLREMHKAAWIGKFNPRYKHIDKDTLLSAVLSENRIADAAKILGVSHHKIIASCVELFGVKPSELKKNNQTL